MLRVFFLRAVFAVLAMLVIRVAPPVAAQESPVATDVTSAAIQKFINELPRDRVSDRAIRIVKVTGDYQVGVWGVFRPKEFPGGANLHEVNTTEISYMVEGVATLVTGGTMTETNDRTPGRGIVGGVSRRFTKGYVIIIPGHTAHWFSELETDIDYLIFRTDPDNSFELR